MSSEILSVIDQLENLVSVVILIFALFRAIAIGRASASTVYRRRAFWIAGLMITWIIAQVALYLPNAQSITLFGIYLPAILFVAAFLVTLAFVDSSILVTMELDFFHRNTLHWRQLRVIAYVLMFVFVSLVVVISSGGQLPQSQVDILALVAQFLIFAIFGGVFGYAVITLAIGARRTQDRTMKRHVTLLGASIGLLIINILLVSALEAFPVVGDSFGLITAYLLYRAVMSLSALSRIED